jgi:heme exporter protein CcmB
MKSSSWAVKAGWLLFKDLKSEFRTRYALNAIFMFGLTTLTVVSFSIGGISSNTRITSSLFWLVIFFSSMSGLAQVFVKEEESKTVNVLKLSASPGIVLAGKLLFNLVLLLILELVIVPLFIIWMNLSILNIWLFLSVLLLGSLGLACATTITAAIQIPCKRSTLCRPLLSHSSPLVDRGNRRNQKILGRSGFFCRICRFEAAFIVCGSNAGGVHFAF